MGMWGIIPLKAAREQSNQATLRALDLNEMLPEAHSMRGVLRAIEYDWKGAEREFRMAFELDPKSDEVWTNYTWHYLTPMRRFDEAIAAMQKVLERDPLSLIAQCLLGYWHLFLRKWDEASRHWRNALDLDAQYSAAHLFLGLSYIQKGMIAEGIKAAETALPLWRQVSLSLGLVGLAFARAGRTGTAQDLLKELQDRAQNSYVLPSSFALIYFGIGDIDNGFDWLEKAVDEHDDWVVFIHADSSFDPLRSHTRYRALLRKMNLEP
jgi:tetratricopeptide (TPR) repeat protein